MVTLELCYETPRGAGVVRRLHDATSTEKALKRLMHRHIEANLYVSGAQDEQGNRLARVGGVDHTPGTLWNGREVGWQYWFDPAVFAVTPVVV
ncbi:MAG: hypothetical protein WCD86_16965 [Ktedonobacteraceae bacterium]